MERRLTAILIADVVGYSRLVRENEERTLATLKELHGSLVAPLIANHRGRVVKYLGDGLLAEFPSVVDAVRAAVALQTAMAERSASISDKSPIVYRVGINLGDVVIDGDDIQGDGVNVAARLEGLSDPGGICISDAVREQTRDRIDARFDDDGEHQVKNIERPIRVWRWSPGAPSLAIAPAAPLQLPDKPSIAVLPFDNFSNDPEQEFFADGMTEDIITELSRFENLFVIARNTSFAYKGHPTEAKAVARELGVQFILEGSVRKVGQRVRITAQLIKGSDGSHVWAERYDGTLEDVFDLQEQVTGQVVGSISPQMIEAGLAQIGRGERIFDDAHERSWKAQETLRSAIRLGDPDKLERAIGIAVSAVEMNPKCSIAYQTICYAFSLQSLFRWGSDPSSSADRAEQWARRFLSELPNSYMAHYSRGVALFRKGRCREANRDFQHAHGLNPNDSVVLRFWAFCEASAGEFEDAKAHAQLAIRLNPKDEQIDVAYLALAMAAYIENETDEFEEWINRAIQLDPHAPLRRALMVAYAAEAENQTLLDVHRAELMHSSPSFVDSVFSGENAVFQQPAHTEKLLNGLRKAGFSG